MSTIRTAVKRTGPVEVAYVKSTASRRVAAASISSCSEQSIGW
jgi:hypothetical protein